MSDTLEVTASVRDGLCPREGKVENSGEIPSEHLEVRGDANQLETLSAPGVVSLQFPEESTIRVHHGDMRIPSIQGRVRLDFHSSGVHNPANAILGPPGIMDGQKHLFSPQSIVQNATESIMELPLMRTSVRLESMDISEREAFLREAEVLKGIPADRAELLAVFRNVPIAMVSRLRFVAEKKAIVYALSRELRLTQARVHDLAVVCDRGSREIHLVAHRTQFQSVNFN
jgi:hypothetical protein